MMVDRGTVQFFPVGGAIHVGSDTETRLRWTVGTGLEYSLDNHWSLKVEYVYLDFASFSYLAPAVSDAANTWTVNVLPRDLLYLPKERDGAILRAEIISLPRPVSGPDVF